MAQLRMRIPIRLKEFEQLSPDQRQAVLEEAFLSVDVSHGQMSNVAHYVGCTLIVILVLLMMITGQSILLAILAGIPMYFGSLAVGLFFWRRSITLELEKVIKQLIAREEPNESA
jgi:hypothetical protein